MSPDAPRVVPDDDEPIELPSAGRPWLIALSIVAVMGTIVYLLGQAIPLESHSFWGYGNESTDDGPRLMLGGLVLIASLAAPLVPAILGVISMDRVVPFAGALSVLMTFVFVSALPHAWRAGPDADSADDFML